MTGLCAVALAELSPDYIYWKCDNSAYLWQTDKAGQNPVQARAAAWDGGFDNPLAAMTPDGAIIVELNAQNYCYASIRKHDAVSGSYVDMRISGYRLSYEGPVGCDNNYVYWGGGYSPGNVIDKFSISDGYHVSGTTIDRYSNGCFNFGVMNDTVWVGDGSGYLYAYPTSWMDGGSHSAARSQYIGDMSGTPLGMTWDGTYYYIAGSPNYLRVYNRDWSSHTDYTVGSGLPSIISPMAVAGSDVGVAEVLEPSGIIDTLAEIPKAKVTNYGALTASFDVWFEIRDSATKTLRYLQKVTATDLAGGSDYLAEFPEWDVPAKPEGWYCATAWTELHGDLDVQNDTARSQFAVEAKQQGPPAWTRWGDVPAGEKDREVKQGAAAATDPMGLYVYLLKGSNTCEFYRYDPATGSWLALDPIPERGRDNKKRNVDEGGTLAQVNGKFYATKGGKCLEFWEYDPAGAQGYRWTQKADVPAGTKDVHSGAGAAGVQIGPSSFVYLLKASETFEFYRYDVAQNSWEARANAPGDKKKKWGEGSCVSSDGVDTVYALKGGENEFYAYVVSTNTWLARPDLPLGPKKKQAKGGAAICYHLRNVYCLKGGNTQEFWVYNCDANTWTPGSDVPLGPRKTRVQDGGALVYCRASRYLFATKGNSLEFWSYGHLSNYPTIQSGEEVIALGAGVNTYGLATASVLVPGRDRVCFALPKPGIVSLKLYDMTGRVARVLANGWHAQGRHEVSLNAQNLARGVYILKLQSDACSLARKVVIE